MASPTQSARSGDNARRPIPLFVRKLLPFGLFVAAGIVLIVLLGLAQRVGWLRSSAAPTAAGPAGSQAVYTCPMHPQIRQPGPGRCPICGMELVVASAAAGKADELAVRIEPAQRRLANIQTAEVQKGPLEDTLDTIGVIATDESRQATIAAYIDGRLERLFADYTGIRIAAGDHLAVIYSPQLYAAQVEYLEARRVANSNEGLAAVRNAQQLLAANTRRRLVEYGMTEEQITLLERDNQAQSRLTIYSPQGGTVIEKLAVEGNYVQAGDPIYRIAELSTVWLMLKLFPEDATRIRFGQEVNATVQSLQGERFLGRIAFIDPTVDPQTRTVGVRVELMNEHGRLRPGDYAKARIQLPIGPQGKVYDAALAGKWISPMHPQIIRDEPGECPICGMDLVPTADYGFTSEPVPQPESLFVPRSAVLLAGSNSVVYVETEPGRFEIRPVTVGPILEDRIVILEGLAAGEKVATSGNFLIDSQMQLAGKPSLIDPSRLLASKQEQAEQKGPLVLDPSTAGQTVGGEAGEQLKQFYDAYFQVQRALASDQKPAEAAAQAVHDRAQQLAKNSDLSEPARQRFGKIARESEHFAHLPLDGVRQAFKKVSPEVIRLSAEVRSSNAQQVFTHFYCPMVPGGGGDWLQADDQLLNPYFGSEMLRCGEKVQEIPVPSAARSGDSQEQAGSKEKAKPAQNAEPQGNEKHDHGPSKS